MSSTVGYEFDYVVVGAGAAGCVVAGRLAAARPRRTVLLIEYGGRPVNPLLHVPKGFYYTLRGDRYLYRYQTRPVGPGRANEVWLRGKVLGGSAAVNGMMWTRGAPADWDGLAARGNPGWSWADVLPAYLAMEDHGLGASETRGGNGPFGISVTEPGDAVTGAILASAVKHGWRHVEDVNASDTERIGFTPSSISNGRRTTSYSSFVRPLPARRAFAPGTGRVIQNAPGILRSLPSLRPRANLTVATRTRAVRLLFGGQGGLGGPGASAGAPRVTGVRVRVGARGSGDGATHDVRARREVIVCAGAIETPLLLERSGIGRPDVLRAVGIDLVAESPNVGERLIEQRGVALQVRLRPDALGDARLAGRLATWPGRVAEAIGYLATRRGQLATAGYDLVCQFKSAPELDRPDIQGLFAPLALDTTSADMRLARHPGILFLGYPIRPQTTSSVHVTGPGPGDPPVIEARFLEAEADRRSVAPVLGIVRDLLATPPVAGLIADEEFPGPSVATGEDVIRYSLATGTGIYHAVGSAAMGGSDDDVADPWLRVRGVTGLRVADASVLPAQVSGNTAAPAMLVGYRAADLILAGS